MFIFSRAGIIASGLRGRFQNHRLVVLLIPRAVHQSDGVFLALLLQQFEGVFPLAKFLPVTGPKLLPFRRIVTEPLAQLRARRHVLSTTVSRPCASLVKPRPQPIDQNSQAVLSGRLFVNSLQLDHCGNAPSLSPVFYAGGSVARELLGADLAVPDA